MRKNIIKLNQSECSIVSGAVYPRSMDRCATAGILSYLVSNNVGPVHNTFCSANQEDWGMVCKATGFGKGAYGQAILHGVTSLVALELGLLVFK